MKKRGSITVFLALVLVILFSFLLTVLEGARIRGAVAYAEMLNRLSGDSYLATYYAPLFEKYGIFGVDAGYGDIWFSKENTEGMLGKGVSYGTAELKGGLFAFSDAQTKLTNYQTLLTGEGEDFLRQAREQVLLEGCVWGLADFFSPEDLQDAAYAGEIYEQQQTALSGTLPVSRELLRLMELVDGIQTTETGLKCSEEGRLLGNPVFIKKLVPMEKRNLCVMYGTEEVFSCVEPYVKDARKAAEAIRELVNYGIELQERINQMEEELVNIEEQTAKAEEMLKEEGVDKELQERYRGLQEKRKTVSAERDIAVEEYDLVLMDAEEQYLELRQDVSEMIPLHLEVRDILNRLETRQIAAREGVVAYERYLLDMQGQVSEELYQVFLNELMRMKSYLGMEEQGYYVPRMQQSIEQNLVLLADVYKGDFLYEDLETMQEELFETERLLSMYTVEGLWFTYGEIHVTKDTGVLVTDLISDLLSEKLLSLLLVKEYSERVLNGTELPSMYQKPESVLKTLSDCLRQVREMIGQGTMKELFAEGAKELTDRAVLELYTKDRFGSFLDVRESTKLLYEREYLLFGNQKDMDNLMATVLYLAAVRTLFCVVSCIKSPELMAEVEAFAIAAAGMTGIPLLVSATKYMVIFAWALEEALVETAALLQGKCLPVLHSENRIGLSELFSFGKELVEEKVSQIPEYGEVGYGEYLMLLSVLKDMKGKTYRIFDLIQENIRMEFKDTFRIRNVVTYVEYQSEVNLKERFDVGIFAPTAYKISVSWQCGY